MSRFNVGDQLRIPGWVYSLKVMKVDLMHEVQGPFGVMFSMPSYQLFAAHHPNFHRSIADTDKDSLIWKDDPIPVTDEGARYSKDRTIQGWIRRTMGHR